MSNFGKRNAEKARFYRVAPASIALAAALGACSPDAARSDRRAPGDAFDPSVVLEGGKAAAAERSMTGATAGHAATPLAASPVPRWSDVEMAIRNVAGRTFVGVRSVASAPDRIAAVTVLDDGQVGGVVATRDPSGAIAFDCRLSTFPDATRDGAFARALGDEMRRLAAIPRPVTPAAPATATR